MFYSFCLRPFAAFVAGGWTADTGAAEAPVAPTISLRPGHWCSLQAGAAVCSGLAWLLGRKSAEVELRLQSLKEEIDALSTGLARISFELHTLGEADTGQVRANEARADVVGVLALDLQALRTESRQAARDFAELETAVEDLQCRILTGSSEADSHWREHEVCMGWDSESAPDERARRARGSTNQPFLAAAMAASSADAAPAAPPVPSVAPTRTYDGQLVHDAIYELHSEVGSLRDSLHQGFLRVHQHLDEACLSDSRPSGTSPDLASDGTISDGTREAIDHGYSSRRARGSTNHTDLAAAVAAPAADAAAATPVAPATIDEPSPEPRRDRRRQGRGTCRGGR